MQLTVLICTHDRAALLRRTIDSLNSAVRPNLGAQLFVVANHCSDDTHGMLDDYLRNRGERLPLRWVSEPRPGKSHALNHALSQVATPLLAFVDDDQRVHSGFLVEIERAAAAFPTSDLFCGRITPDWDGTEPPWVHDDGPYRVYPLPIPRFEKGDTSRELTEADGVPGGGNLFLRTHWVARIGSFATDMGPTGHDLGGAEDLDWILRGLRLGARLRYVPEVVQYHFVDAERLTLGYLMKKAYKRTAANVLLEPQKRRGDIPHYLYRKLAQYGLAACTSLGMQRRRFYLVRTAAATGELVARWREWQQRQEEDRKSRASAE